MTMLRAGGLLDVLTSLSDSRQETVEKIMERTENFGGFVYVLDRFPQRELGWGVITTHMWVSFFDTPGTTELYPRVSTLCFMLIGHSKKAGFRAL